MMVYAGFLFGFFLLPQKVWLSLLQVLRKTHRQGELFREQIEHLCLQENFTQEKIVPYKFFSKLVERLLGYARQYGVPYKKSLKAIRQELIKDKQFEVRKKQAVSEDLLQFLLAAVMVWSFMLSYRYLLDSNLPDAVIIIALGQLAGFVCYFGFLQWQHSKIGQQYSQVFSCLYSLALLFSIGVPYEETLKLSGFNEWSFHKESKLKKVKYELTFLLESLRQQGRSISQPLQNLIEELWFQQEKASGQLLKQQKVVKLIVLAFCFLSGYFYFLFHLFLDLSKGSL